MTGDPGKSDVPKLVVFDLDGTLIDAFADIAAAANHIRAEAELPPLPVDEVKRHVGHGARRLVAGVLGTADEDTIERAHASLVAFYAEHPHDKATWYAGALESVSVLKAAGTKLAVSTNKPHAVAVKVIEAMGAAASFDTVLGEGRFAAKPDPASLLWLMAEHGATAGTTVMVGDSAVDVAYAKAAGVKVIGLGHGQCTAEELRIAGADLVLEGFDGLFNAIGAMRAAGNGGMTPGI